MNIRSYEYENIEKSFVSFLYIFLPRGDGRCETLALGSLGDPVEDDFASCDSSRNRAKQERQLFLNNRSRKVNTKELKNMIRQLQHKEKNKKTLRKQTSQLSVDPKKLIKQTTTIY